MAAKLAARLHGDRLRAASSACALGPCTSKTPRATRPAGRRRSRHPAAAPVRYLAPASATARRPPTRAAVGRQPELRRRSVPTRRAAARLARPARRAPGRDVPGGSRWLGRRARRPARAGLPALGPAQWTRAAPATGTGSDPSPGITNQPAPPADLDAGSSPTTPSSYARALRGVDGRPVSGRGVVGVGVHASRPHSVG